MRYLYILTAVVVLIASSIGAMSPCYSTNCIVEGVDAAIDLTVGYRYDKITASVEGHNHLNSKTFSDSLQAKNLNIYEVGLDGRVIVCRDWFVRLYGTLGRVGSGNYLETVKSTEDGERSRLNAQINSGITRDFSVGAGYLFPCSCWFGIGPVGGWSYNYQRLQLGKAKTGELCNPIFGKLRYKNRWQGPWIGVEAQCTLCNAWLEVGYEYHWSHWHASWSLRGPNIPGIAISDRRKSNGAFGNVIFLKAVRMLCDNWEIGLGAKLQYWKVNNGKIELCEHDREAIATTSNEIYKLSSASWHSYEAMIMLGYHF